MVIDPSCFQGQQHGTIKMIPVTIKIKAMLPSCLIRQLTAVLSGFMAVLIFVLIYKPFIKNEFAEIIRTVLDSAGELKK